MPFAVLPANGSAIQQLVVRDRARRACRDREILSLGCGQAQIVLGFGGRLPRRNQYRAADRVAPVQRSLRSPQDRNALDVEQILRRQQIVGGADAIDPEGHGRLPGAAILPYATNHEGADTNFLVVRKTQVRRQ